MGDRYGNDGDWRREPWWQHDQNPGQGFSAWRGDASDPEWHQRPYGRGVEPDPEWHQRPLGRVERDGWGRGPSYGRSPRGRDQVREDYDRDYGQDFGGGRAYGYGRHAGRGPKGYRRSDERIREDINDLLTADPHIDASDVEVRVASGVVTLSGIIEDRAAKRYAEDLAERVVGVDDVNNHLTVRRGLLSGMSSEHGSAHGSERELSREPSREGGTAVTGTSSTRRAK